MKWKNNVVLLVAYFIGSVHDSVQTSITRNATIDCNFICSNIGVNKSSTAEENYCKCSKIQNHALHNNIDGNNEDSFKNTITEAFNSKKTIRKRDTISELIARRQKNKNQSSKSITFLPAENSVSKWQLNRNVKTLERPQIKFKNSGLLYDNKLNARIRELEYRMKELRSKISMKPNFQSRNAFPDSDTTKNIIEQLKGRREEILKDLKKFQSKSLSGKDARNVFRERVGSVNPMQNQFEGITSRFKSKISSKSDSEDEENSKDTIKIDADSEDDTNVNGNKHISSASSEIASSTPHIPLIILRQSDSSSSKPENTEQKEFLDQKESLKPDIAPVVETTTKKVESVSLTLEKLKGKRQETVMKIKDKLSAAKSNLKHLEKNEES